MKPITPSEVAKARQATLPDFVIRAFNECIVAGWEANAGASVFNQDDVVRLIIQYGGERVPHGRQQIFNERWLDVEDVYRQRGWDVKYDKPGYNEDYPATFTFTVPF